MPWAEREQMLKDAYNIEVSERTLRKWCNKLFDNNSAVKIEAAKVYWRTIKADGKSYRELVSGDDELEQEMRDYYSYRRKLLKVMSWEETNKELWSKYGCCYYSCKFIAFSAFGDNGNLLELYELIKQIIDNDRE